MEELESKIGYCFQNKQLLRQALTHPSAAKDDNQRLEFLGDAVLELAVSERIYLEFAAWPEGKLTALRADLVCENTLNDVAERLALGKHIILGKGERMAGGRNKPSILSDALEAVIGAVYLDGGFQAAKEAVDEILRPEFADPQHIAGRGDYKSELQEYCQKTGQNRITYHLTETKGPAHNRSFFVDLLVGGKFIAHGKGKSKKHAEQDAACKALEILKNNEGEQDVRI